MSQIGALVGGLWGDAGENFVNEQGGASKVFGTKPEVAPYVPIDLGEEIGKATGFNLENLDAITGLLDKVIPNFSELLQTGTANALALTRGELPQTDVEALMRSSAFKALQGGFGGTPMGTALSLRDLGISTLQGQEAGANMAQLWAKQAEEAYSPFLVSTGQTAGTTAANNAGLQAQQQFQFNVDAAPDPGALGIFNVDAALGQQMLSFGMASLGGIGGGGGGGGATAQYMGTGSAQAPVGGYPMPGYNLPSNYSSGYAVNDWRSAQTWGGG